MMTSAVNEIRPATASGKRTIATLPTYQEAANIREVTEGLRRFGIEVLVADDNSPDGTWKIAQEMADGDAGVHLLLRRENKGRGRAGAEAFTRAMALGAERIVEMDADLSHRPEDVPRLLAALDAGADIAVGSRFAPGGSDARPSPARRRLTRLSTAYARRILGVKIADCNSGFRAYSRGAMSLVEPETLASPGPDIVHEVLLRAHRRGLRIVEVPITFVDRERGESQLTFRRLLRGFAAVVALRCRAERGLLWARHVRS